MTYLSGKSKPQAVPIYVGGRVVGRVVGRTFHKSIQGSKHLLRSPRAICFDTTTLVDAAKAGATRVEIFDSDSRITYSATLDTIDAYAFSVLRGHGSQVGLTLDHWSVNGAIPVVELRAAQTNAERKELQMTLFAEMS